MFSNTENTRKERYSGMLGYGFALLMLPSFAWSVDWKNVPDKEVVLFSPGQISWEYILTESKHSASKSVREGINCIECHQGEQEKIGLLVASGKKMEPHPLIGDEGSTKLSVKFAIENDRLLTRLHWKESAVKTDQDKKYRSKVAILLSDGTIKSSKLAGCWGACHVDMTSMPGDKPEWSLSKYIFKSRNKPSREGGGDRYKSSEELQALMDKGLFFEMWRAKLNPGKPAQAISGYVLDKRHEDDVSSIEAESKYQNGEWTVTMSRPLKNTKPDQFNLELGKTYYIGFSIHDGHTDGRFHQVSFGYSLGLESGKADFVVERH